MTYSQGMPVIYHLFATLNHEGYSCRSGHYVAFSKRNGQWLSHNDVMVSFVFSEDLTRDGMHCIDDVSTYNHTGSSVMPQWYIDYSTLLGPSSDADCS